MLRRLLTAFRGLDRPQKLAVAFMVVLILVTWAAACYVVIGLL